MSLGTHRTMTNHLSLTGELQYAASNVWVSDTEYVDLRTIRAPISTRFQLWKLYGVVPQGSLGVVFGTQYRTSFDLSDAVQKNNNGLKMSSTTSVAMNLNIGGAIPHRFGYLQIDFHHYSSFTSVSDQEDIRVREQGLMVGYLY